ncbi:MAG: S8 family serine peptidase [Terrimicrobiaceae bacterium]|nr:S8 family serine peptidase [Terrimicrobiaceae bacterium]
MRKLPPPVSIRHLTCAALLAGLLLGGSPARALEAHDDILAGAYDGTPGSFEVVNFLVGAQTLYQAGYLGQRTIVANVEAGLVWGGHEVFDRSGLGLPNSPALTFNAPRDPVTAPDLGDIDFHATMVGHVLAGTGYVGNGNLSLLGAGMAPLATLWSGAIATTFDRTEANIGSFEISDASFLAPYQAFFEGAPGAKPDVINSSWGFDDPAATAKETRILDGLAAANPTVTLVKSAGNGGLAAPPGGPGSGFNGITVGSLGGSTDAQPYLRPSTFTSGGAADFFNPATGITLTGVRAAVAIAAPGEQFALAYYGGKSGALADLVGDGDPATDKYFLFNQSGTSFSSPVVAGGIALLKDVSYGGVYLDGEPEARDTRVIKSVIQAGATVTTGWDNGQHVVDGVVTTTQALDFATGAGRLDLAAAVAIYVGGTTDVPGAGGGTIAPLGWDIGSVGIGAANDYFFDLSFDGETELTVSLNWFVNGAFDDATGLPGYGSFANLDLGVWTVTGGTFGREVAVSESIYGNSEFLRFQLDGGSYGLRVSFAGVLYDLTSSLTSETYGLAWEAAAVPEPAEWGGAVGLVLFAMAALRWRSRLCIAARPR